MCNFADCKSKVCENFSSYERQDKACGRTPRDGDPHKTFGTNQVRFKEVFSMGFSYLGCKLDIKRKGCNFMIDNPFLISFVYDMPTAQIYTGT